METINNIENTLKNFIEKFGKYRGDVSENTYTVDLTFENQNTTLEISYSPKLGYIIKLPSKNKRKPCLHLKIFQESQQIIGEIGYIRANQKCKMPKTSKGTWLVNLAEAICCELGIKTLRLQDSAMVPCDKKETNMLMLRILIYNKRSWYQDSFKYIKNFNTLSIQSLYGYYDEGMYNYDVNSLRNLPMIFVVNIVNYLARNYTEELDEKYNISSNELKDLSNLFSVYLFDKKSLSEYMSILYKDKCTFYLLLEEFLEKTSTKDFIKWKIFPWSNLYQKILSINSNLHKNLDCNNIKNLII